MRRRPLTPAALALLAKGLEGAFLLRSLTGLERRTLDALCRMGWMERGVLTAWLPGGNSAAVRALVEASLSRQPSTVDSQR